MADGNLRLVKGEPKSTVSYSIFDSRASYTSWDYVCEDNSCKVCLHYLGEITESPIVVNTAEQKIDAQQPVDDIRRGPFGMTSEELENTWELRARATRKCYYCRVNDAGCIMYLSYIKTPDAPFGIRVYCGDCEDAAFKEDREDMIAGGINVDSDEESLPGLAENEDEILPNPT